MEVYFFPILSEKEGASTLISLPLLVLLLALARASILSLRITLRINVRSERSLETSHSHRVHNMSPQTQKNTRRGSLPQRSRQKIDHTALVHGVIAHIEWESSHLRIHQNSEIITKVGASDTQHPEGREN